MSISTVQFFSQALAFPVTFNLILPREDIAGRDPYPVLLQLHGKYDDACSWLHKSNLARYVENLPLIVVLPGGGNYYWSNLHPLLRYEDFLAHDLWEYINSTQPVRPASPWAIGGLSMGGYGAIRLGLKYPEKFCSVYAHSSFIPDAAIIENLSQEMQLNLPPDMDCHRLAAQVDPAVLPRLSFDCGLEDGLLQQNRAFHAHLQALNLPHTYHEYPGGHTWSYWDLHVQSALLQHAEVLGISPKG